MWYESEIGERSIPTVRVSFSRLFVWNTRYDNYRVSVIPIYGSCDCLFHRELAGVYQSKNFVEISTRCHGIGQNRLDFFCLVR